MALAIARVHLIALLLGATVYAVAGTHYRAVAVTGLQGVIPKAGINATVKTLRARSLILCGIQCKQEPHCGAIFYSKAAENCYLMNKQPTLDQLVEDASTVCLSRPKDCPAEFLHDENRSFCHKVVLNALSHEAAAAQCEQWGSGLVSIETEEENNYLSSLPTAINQGLWTSGNDIENEQSWVWHGNVTMDFTVWEVSTPPVVHRGENCMRLYGGLWHDYPCNHEYFFICEIYEF